MSMLESYKKLVSRSPIPDDNIRTHVINPNDSDYTRGFISRYFAQKVTDVNSPIFEVNEKVFSRLQNNQMYVVVVLKWRITGPKETQYREDGQLLDVSVSESNRRAILLNYDKIPKLKLYLPNLLQFYK
jgi:hypothetical protein